MADPTKVLVVDDHEVIAEGLAALIDAAPDLSVVGLAHTAADGLRVAAGSRPDVILLDYHLPDRDGDQATRHFKTLLPETAVIILTSDASDEVLLASFEAGASGYLPKTRAARQVLQAIRLAATGETLISGPTLARVLQHKATAARVADGMPHLTDRELDVLRAMARGLDTEAIADRYTLTIATTRTYVQVILRKLDAHSRLQAVVRANELGLLRQPAAPP